MTTDPFIEAARAEAERRTPLGGHTAPALTQERAGLVAMAEWARTHLAAQEPTDAEHRIARLEAQTDIRGRAVAIYQRRAREAEAERDWNWRSSRQSKIERIKANTRADKAEAERDMLLDDLRKAEQRADQAEARVRNLEGTARVLVGEALDAETARDEHRRRADEAEAEARTQRHRADDMEDNALRAQTNLRAAEERVDEWRQAALEESAAQPRPLMHETPPAITLSRIRQLTYNAKRRNETIRPDQILAILERRKA